MVDEPPPGLVSMLVADATRIDRERRAAISRAEAAEAVAEGLNTSLRQANKAATDAESTLAALKAENERLRKLLTPIAKIAEWEADAEPGESVFVNIDRCRDARDELETVNG